MATEQFHQSSTAPGDIFATTHWTVVLAAGRRSTPQADSALEQLCRTYWFPLYAYVRRRGYTREDAEDLTQAFFARFLAKNYLGSVSAERGRFRAFLLVSMKHFLANEWNKAQRQKRGGGEKPLSLDWQSADTKFQVAANNGESPDKAFDREWALTLLNRVVENLRRECEADGKGNLFAKLKIFLTTDKDDASPAAMATELGMDQTAVRVAIHRLRKRYRQLLRAEIRNTLSEAGDVAEEMRALFNAFL
ncbi:MAG TPA: sigma-70 family RNA polymerase sigma factor [Verrucomicrobiae bacterium]|nr:sigma-70 family RNA polymerase sigma factor [Verrucomicrobiae bacterium]